MGLLNGNFLNYLPDDPQKKEAMRAGLLSFGAAMLSGRGNFGSMAGQGLGAGLQGYQGSIQQSQKDAMEAAQLKLLQGKDARAQEQHEYMRTAFAEPPAPGPGQAPGPNATPDVPGPTPPSQRSAAALVGGSPDLARLPMKSQAMQSPGSFPLNLNQVARLKAFGGPDLSSEYKMAHEGFKREQGATYEMPNGTRQTYAKLDNGQVQGDDGSITSAPGYNTTMAATEGAKAEAVERAKAGYDLLPLGYVDKDERPIGGTRGEYIVKTRDLPRLSPGGPPRPVVRPGAPVTPVNFPRVSPGEQEARDATRLEILQQERGKITNPADLAAIDREIAGAGGRPVLQSASEGRAKVGAVETTLKAGQDLNSNWMKETLNPIQTEAKAARATLTQIETVRNIGLKTGWGTQAQASAASFLAALGVKDANRFAAKVETFQQVAMERNMTMLQAQSGPQTEGDSQRAQQTWMRVQNTPSANRFIADMTEATARLTMKKDAFYREALPIARVAGDLTEIDRRWSKIAPSVWADPALARYKAK